VRKRRPKIKKQVKIGKVDLDTCGAAFLLGIDREDKVEILKDQAPPYDLADPRIICIEVGGRGWFWLNNWDHHGDLLSSLPSSLFEEEKNISVENWQRVIAEEISRRSATYQVYYLWKIRDLLPHPSFQSLSVVEFLRTLRVSSEAGGVLAVDRLVSYIDQLDVEGPSSFSKKEDIFPSLSDVFSGMLLSIRDPLEQFHCGIEILKEIVRRGIDPFGRMPIKKILSWYGFAEAKAENNRQVAEAIKKAHWDKTQKGLNLAWLETNFFGAPGALYGVGADVVVVYSPQFGPAKVPKFTIAGKDTRVDSLLPELNKLEPGWGGPPTGTIIGSPREGSRLTLEEVVEIVKKNL